eukprot:CAMPEP_0173294406 /NCGR_PEP_ID=MMETSP1143-20121109/13858_1 /TAXON_ID=483371 /ORGANISM="non described non described, Strain CCMP2298" /LENGTH=269 /DNA_ID=CAMNT_0014234085 /DNA_START=1 /DNA_END=806 /DNA_ORIENTATION=+
MDSSESRSERKQPRKQQAQLAEMIDILERDAAAWSREEVDEVSATPCVDVFLQERMLQVAAQLLQRVHFPLLPLAQVHKPVLHLLSLAVRYDAMHGQVSSSSTTSSSTNTNTGPMISDQEASSYGKRIEIGLAVLLRVLWRRFSEQPSLLTFFIVEDRRKKFSARARGSRTTASEVVIETQIDAVNALVALLHRPPAAVYAEEALLVALSMRDVRIERFLLEQTPLVPQVVSALCRSFLDAVEAANEAASSNSSPAYSGLSGPGAMGAA